MNRYSNKKILVTGGASGIGKAICERLISEGADLAFIDRNIKDGKEVEKELRNAQREAKQAIKQAAILVAAQKMSSKNLAKF